jgi:hypothetical protein
VWKSSAALILFAPLLLTGCRGVYLLSWEIPAGFTGWVRVKYSDPACARQGKDWFRQVIRVAPDGTACTDLDLNATTINDYFRINETGERVSEIRETHWGEGGLVWGGKIDLEVQQREYFVGTEVEFRDPLSRHREGWSGAPITNGPGVNFEIPAGYHGSVEVSFGDTSCEGSRLEGQRLVVAVSSGGRGCSSAHRMPSEGPIVYFELKEDGRKTQLLWTGLDPAQGRIMHESARRDGSRFAFSVLAKPIGSE